MHEWNSGEWLNFAFQRFLNKMISTVAPISWVIDVGKLYGVSRFFHLRLIDAPRFVDAFLLINY